MKLDPTADKEIFAGYSKVSKAYKIFVPTRTNIIV
jgi:hypothetical protein